MSIILAIILLLVAIGAFLSGLVNKLVEIVGLVPRLVVELNRNLVEVIGINLREASEIGRLAIVAFIVLTGYLLIRNTRE